MLSNYDYYVSQCKRYVKYHLEHTNNSQKNISKIITEIYNNKNNINYKTL